MQIENPPFDLHRYLPGQSFGPNTHGRPYPPGLYGLPEDISAYVTAHKPVVMAGVMAIAFLYLFNRKR